MSSTPTLSQYFPSNGNNEKSESGSRAAGNISATQSVDEPEVCRLFTKVQVQPKDPTALFFDLIGNANKSSTAPNISTSLELPTTNDGFSARVAIGTEEEKRRDAWIPSEKTRQSLIASATAAAGTYFPDRELLTMPGVLLEEELTDNVSETVTLCLGEAEAAQRRALTAEDVTQDERGLRELIQAGAYRAAVNLTARLLTIYGQGRGRAGYPTKHSPHSLQLWFTRIALLLKIKLNNFAQAEAEPFGQLDRPDLFYQFYPEMYGSRPGSIASFSFRLLLAELPMHCGKPKESITLLFNLLSIVRQLLTNLGNGLCEDGSPTEMSGADRNDSIKLWTGREVRVMHSIIDCALVLRDFEMAMDILRQLYNRKDSPKQALLSALGRLHLQLGDVAGAESCFNEANDLKTGPSDVRTLVDQGLIAVAQNAFSDAYTSFHQASLIEPQNVMIINNMAVCLLYGSQLKEAIALLESAITATPVQALQESLILNLCTLYDMESSNGRMKKFALLRQIAKYQADAPAQILEKLYG